MPLDHLGFDNFRIFGSIHRISCNLRSPFVTLWHNYEEKEEQQQANLGERIATRSPAQTSRHEVDIVRLLFSTHLGKMTKSFDNRRREQFGRSPASMPQVSTHGEDD
ncbi:uncharacterized protein LOC144005396 isoform X2 [Festucalex cinctus]